MQGRGWWGSVTFRLRVSTEQPLGGCLWLGEPRNTGNPVHTSDHSGRRALKPRISLSPESAHSSWGGKPKRYFPPTPCHGAEMSSSDGPSMDPN